jgi:hypothetical protein
LFGLERWRRYSVGVVRSDEELVGAGSTFFHSGQFDVAANAPLFENGISFISVRICLPFQVVHKGVYAMNYPKLFLLVSHRIAAWSMMALVSIGLGIGGGNLHAQATGSGSLEALPYRDPQPLQDLLNLDDTRLQNRLNNDWDQVRQTLELFFPAGSATSGTSRAFAGSQSECLRNRSAVACRVYLSNLVTINKEKQQQGGLLANPLAPM